MGPDDGYAIERLIASHPQLQACNLTQERGYTDAGMGALVTHGSDPQTAQLAAQIGTACYGIGHDEVIDEPLRPPKPSTERSDAWRNCKRT